MFANDGVWLARSVGRARFVVAILRLRSSCGAIQALVFRWSAIGPSIGAGRGDLPRGVVNPVSTGNMDQSCDKGTAGQSRRRKATGPRL